MELTDVKRQILMDIEELKQRLLDKTNKEEPPTLKNILSFLNESPGVKFKSIEIAEGIDSSPTTIRITLQRLRQQKRVKFKIVPTSSSGGRPYLYWAK